MIGYNNSAPKAVNNVGQFGATEGSIGAYKSAAEYAADAKYWALLSQTKYSSVEDLLAEVERLHAQGLLMESDIEQLKNDFEEQNQALLGLIQSTGTAIDNTNAATELSKEATQEVLAQLDIISNMTVQTTLLPPGSMATGSYDNTTGVFSFGIPEGQPGRDGTDGSISDISDVAMGVPVSDDYGFYVDKENGGLYRANMSDIANLIPSIRSISINGGEEQTGAVSFNSVSSFNSRTGDVVSEVGDYSVEQITGAAKSGANSDITSLSGLTTALSVSQGGTGATSAANARTNLNIDRFSQTSNETSIFTPNTNFYLTLNNSSQWGYWNRTNNGWQPLGIGQGGTGATTPSAARTNLGLGLVSTESIVPITKGGTGSTSAENARLALVAAKSGANSDITSMTNSVTFTQPVSVADAVDATNAVNLGQISSDQGASLIGTLEGVPVQNTISNINTDIVQLKLKWAIENGYSDAGFTFTTGGTLTVNDRDKVVYDPVSKTWYSYSGTLPVVVPAGFNPVGVADWKPQTDPNLREELGRYSPYSFNKVSDIFSGVTASGTAVSLKTGDQVITSGGTVWEVLVDSPSTLAHLNNKRPYNVIDFGADNTGAEDSTSAFVSAGSCEVPTGTYTINDNLNDLYYIDGPVTIRGNGTVKLISKDTQSSLCGTPYDLDTTTGGRIYPSAFSSFNANPNEYLRLPVLTKLPYGDQTYAAYTVLIGSKDDVGQNATQTSRIEIRSSTNNLTFGDPVIISTEGEQQASEPSIGFDKKRGRIWCFYVTARGKVGIGHGSEGFDPNTTLQTWMTYSNTFGGGWSTPINITDKIKPANATSAWVPPSELCVTADGDIILPYGWYITSENMFYQGYIRISENSDGTLNYNRQLISRGGPDGSQGTGECQILQLGDGSLFSMVRDYYNQAGNTKGRQRFYRSYDGVTWNLVSSIDTTNCKAGMGVFSSTASGYPRNAIMVTAPTGNDNSDLYRNNLKMWISGDYGATWMEYPTSMFDEPTISTGYSAVISLGNGAFMVLTEGSAYGVMNVKHRAIGAFTAGSSYARSYGMIPAVFSSDLAELANRRDIPSHSLYWNNTNHTLGVNVAGTAIRLSESSDGVDKGAITTLDADEASVFYMTATTTLSSITTTQNVNRILLVVVSSSQPLTLEEDSSIAIGNRIRTPRTISTAGVVSLWRTKYGWYASP